MSTIADIQATAKAKRDAKSPLDPSVIKNTASGINQGAKTATNTLVGKIPNASNPTASTWVGSQSGGSSLADIQATAKAKRDAKSPIPSGISAGSSGMPASINGTTTNALTGEKFSNAPGSIPPTPSAVGATPTEGSIPASNGVNYDARKNDAYNEFGKNAGLTPENQNALDITRQDLTKVGQGETFEQMYNRMRSEGGYKDVQDTLLKANAEMKTQQEGLDTTQREVFNSGDGVMDSGLQQLRSRNSRDFITNLNHLSNIASNSQAQLTAMNSNIDSVLRMRQDDRRQKTDDLKARIEMLHNTVSPTQLALLKTKLEQKLGSISREEQAQADIVKAKNDNLLKNGDVNSKDTYIQKQGVLKAINDALAPYAAKGVALQVPASAHAENIINLMKAGKTFQEAFQSDFMKPFMASPNVQNVKSQLEGNEWKSTSISRYNPLTGMNETTPVFYRSKGASGFDVVGLDGKSVDSSLLSSNPSNTGYGNTPNVSSTPVSPATVSPESIVSISPRLKGDNVQCGMVSNDYGSQAFPGYKRMGDSYESKVDSIKSIGVGQVPQVGGLFAMNTYNSNGHTGIVQSVDLANGTFTATDANRKGSPNGGPVGTSIYKISDIFTFSRGPQTSQASSPTPYEIKQFESANGTAIPEEYKTPIQKQQYIDKYNAWAGGNGGESGISSLSQVAINTKNITGTDTQKAQVIKELQNRGVFDKGEGNATFYQAKPDVKQEMPNIISAYDSFQKAKAIIDTHKTAGDLNEMLGAWDAWSERKKNGYSPKSLRDSTFGADFATLDNIFGKELSQYMSKISGATVGDKEVERLQRQVPNLDMSETQFDSAMSLYEQSLKNANRFFLNQYGFDDLEKARRVLLGNTGDQNSSGGAQYQSTDGNSYILPTK